MALNCDISIYRSIYRSPGSRNKNDKFERDNHKNNSLENRTNKKNQTIIYPLLKIYNYRPDNQYSEEDRTNNADQHSEQMFYQGMIRGQDIGFEDWWMLIKHHIARYHHINYLLNNNINIDKINYCGQTALIRASKIGNISIVSILISASCVLDIQDSKGCTALIWASRRGHIGIIRKLMSARCALDIMDREENTALVWAFWNDHLKIIDKLISAGCGLDMQKKNGNTILIEASYEGNVEVVKRLIGGGCALNISNNNGDTALLSALNYCASVINKLGREIYFDQYIEIIKMLIIAKSSLDQTNKFGVSALDMIGLNFCNLKFRNLKFHNLNFRNTNIVEILIGALYSNVVGNGYTDNALCQENY